MIRYVDSSVYVKTIWNEPNSARAVATIDTWRAAGSRVTSSALLITEITRAGRRLGVDPLNVRRALDVVYLVGVTNEILVAAGALPGVSLRSLDAIHVATAVAVHADSFLTADQRQAEAARGAGLTVVADFL